MPRKANLANATIVPGTVQAYFCLGAANTPRSNGVTASRRFRGKSRQPRILVAGLTYPVVDIVCEKIRDFTNERKEVETEWDGAL